MPSRRTILYICAAVALFFVIAVVGVSKTRSVLARFTLVPAEQTASWLSCWWGGGCGSPQQFQQYCAFTVDNPSLTVGSGTTIHWDVHYHTCGSTSCFDGYASAWLEDDQGHSWNNCGGSPCTQDNPGSAFVTPAQTTNYFLHWVTGVCYNTPGGLVCNSCPNPMTGTVTVTAAPPPAALTSFSADSGVTSPIQNGFSTGVHWTSNSTSGCYITGPGGGSVASNGNLTTPGLTSTQDYYFGCSGLGQWGPLKINVWQTPSIQFTSGSQTIPSGTSATLNWTGVNVTSCTLQHTP